jgi:CyaY protein
MNPDVSRQIDSTLKELFHAIDTLDRDEIDLEMSDGKFVVEFDDGVKLIVSRQSAADQIWLAEPAGGWHYSWRGDEWIDDKRGTTLKSDLEGLIGGKVGEPVTLG